MYLSDLKFNPLTKEEEHKLITNIQEGKGDKNELAIYLIQKNIDFIRSICFEYSQKTGLDIEDLIQEYLIGYWKSILKFDTSYNTHLITYAHSKGLYYLIKYIDNNCNLDINIDDVQYDLKFSQNIEDNIIKKILLKDILTSISEKEKKIIILKYYYGLSYKEIEDITGIKNKILRQIMWRLKKKINNHFKNNFF